MSNTKSELFEKHPEWILQCKNRPLSTGRGGTQIVLDLTNPEVQDFVFSVIDNLMTQYPEIAYMKWDANSCMLDYGSPYSPKEKQSHLYIEHHRGLNNVLERIPSNYAFTVLLLQKPCWHILKGKKFRKVTKKGWLSRLMLHVSTRITAWQSAAIKRH